MPTGAVHQFHSGTAVGDAITNQMFDLQRRLRRAGYYSEIYSEHIAPELHELIRPLSEFNDRPSTLLLVHHSMGHTAFAELMNIQAPMVTMFHSITPAHFFEDPTIRHFIRLGFAQLQVLARRCELGLAASNHNRHQMYDAGFTSVDVMPVRTDFSELHAVRQQRTSRSDDWLFVGRVVPNKRQVELVRAFSVFRTASERAHLHLVGDLSLHTYVEQVRREVAALGLVEHVSIHGKVAKPLLLDRYRDAGAFVCLSEHEGFGVPLLEAMAAGLPVIARAEAAVAETMGGAGALITEEDPVTVAALARVIGTDDDLRTRMIDHQDQRLQRLERFDVDGLLDKVIARAADRSHTVSVQVQGPFETSYSLAILNRELALALAKWPGYDVTIYATEGPGDYTPDERDLAAHPDAAALYERGARMPYPEIAIRQMFPPRVHDSTAGMTFQYFGWEESRLPGHVVEDFNRHLDGIGTMSSYVKTVLADSGVAVPIAVVGVGVHPPDPASTCQAPELEGLRHTRFLHISSAFPRKGVDVLLRAYFESFTGDDDVTLVLKTFPNPHSVVASTLDGLRREFPNPPHICWIDRDLDRDQLDGLFALASCYVHPARGEGFGLPVAEAMLAGVPVISVASTGLADFVSDRTAAVIRHRMTAAATHLSVPGSEWAEPRLDDLRRELRSFVAGADAERWAERVATARSLIEREYTWDRVADRWQDFIADRRRARSGHSVAAVTTFNSRCGIADYSARLYEAIGPWIHLDIHADNDATPHDDEVETSVRRTWSNHRRDAVDSLLDSLDHSDAEMVHIQYNMGFFTLPELARIIRHEAPRRPVVVTLHRTSPLEIDDRVEQFGDIADDLRLADAIIVHQSADRTRLAESGIVDNVHQIPIGTDEVVTLDPAAARRRHRIGPHSFVVGTYGFLLPHKGLLGLLGAVAELRSRCIDVQLLATCALHPDPSSRHHLAEVEAEIARLDLADTVRLVTDFLESSVSRDLLGCADVLVLPYENTKESASAALRSVLSVGRATVTSDLAIFDDVRGIVPMLPAPVDPLQLADLLEQLWLDPEGREAVATAVRDYAGSTSWASVARRTRQLYTRVISARAAAAPREAASSPATTACAG